jgi:P pilus assembly chaperone PapD
MFKKIIFMLLIGCVLLSQSVLANLLISPTRISIDERERTAKVTVINTSEEDKTYRVIWSEKQSTPTGGYLTLPTTTETSLSPMTRISPKQMRLAPGEKQTVKIAIRKPKGLVSGEYRSHLLFQALPNENTKAASSIKINMIMSYSIPVVLRVNSESPVVEIEQAQIAKNQNNQRLEFALTLKRETAFSSYGKLTAYFKSDNSTAPEKIAEIGNLSIYPEVKKADVTLSLFNGKNLNKPGTVIFKYTGEDEYADINFAEYTLPITTSMLKL